MKLGQFEINGIESTKIITSYLKNHYPNSLVKHSNDRILFFNDDYAFSTNSNLMYCIILDISKSYSTFIEIVSGGGKAGLFIKLDWGSEKSTINMAYKDISQFAQKNGLLTSELKIEIIRKDINK